MKTDEAIRTELQDTRESVTFGADRNKDFSKEPMCLSGRGVTRVFHTGKTTTVAVDHVDFDFHRGELISIVGESGSGKTTLSKMLLGLPVDALDKHSVELSGGMRQRVVIAVSTILSPKVLIADEPSSALDVTSQKMVIKMLKDMLATGMVKSMIFITHELPLLYNVTDDIMVMYAGQIVERGSAHEMVFDPIHPYSRGLMRSILVPEEGTRDVKLTAIPGTPPNPKHPPAGCRFADRCRYATPLCKVQQPPLMDIGGGRIYRRSMAADQLKEVYANED